eukprot:7241121-Pyramimonas_sp.AAC.2
MEHSLHAQGWDPLRPIPNVTHPLPLVGGHLLAVTQSKGNRHRHRCRDTIKTPRAPSPPRQ